MLEIRACFALYWNTEGFSALNVLKTSPTIPLSNVVIWWMQECILFYKDSYESERELSRDAALSHSLSFLCTMCYWSCSFNRLHSMFPHWLGSNDVGVCSVSSTNVCSIRGLVSGCGHSIWTQSFGSSSFSSLQKLCIYLFEYLNIHLIHYTYSFLQNKFKFWHQEVTLFSPFLLSLNITQSHWSNLKPNQIDQWLQSANQHLVSKYS